jgi:DNA gyrase/topoisomerase IV subunit A
MLSLAKANLESEVREWETRVHKLLQRSSQTAIEYVCEPKYDGLSVELVYRNGKLVASFPVKDSDQIMLVTDKGQLIRCPVEGIRIAGRSTQGVIVFDTAEDEHVVSVEHIGEDAENGNGNGG